MKKFKKSTNKKKKEKKRKKKCICYLKWCGWVWKWFPSLNPPTMVVMDSIPNSKKNILKVLFLFLFLL